MASVRSWEQRFRWNKIVNFGFENERPIIEISRYNDTIIKYNSKVTRKYPKIWFKFDSTQLNDSAVSLNPYRRLNFAEDGNEVSLTVIFFLMNLMEH